jgi:hypothetical protein
VHACSTLADWLAGWLEAKMEAKLDAILAALTVPTSGDDGKDGDGNKS